ncbi:MAG: glycerol kinase GlpK [Paracoccaceae bacterium]|nr:glycerol kinase GlpK [Paracoccaceae bacterium]
MQYILAIDQGTTSTRAMIFDEDLGLVAQAQVEFPQHYPASGWVEHDPLDLWQTALATSQAALAKAGIDVEKIAAIGITNQRETTIVWDKATGAPVYNAIVWQDRRTDQMCKDLSQAGLAPLISKTTGLRLDPYFSATKVAWILDRDPSLRAKAEAGGLLFGTVDSWLIWNLTGGARHVTDATNAARTMLYDIHQGQWAPEICKNLRIPMAILPTVLDCADAFGTCLPHFFGRSIPILGVAGDQQAATIGQACFEVGMLKSTYGTGCFALLNTGDVAVVSDHQMLTTIAYQFDGVPTYALEGSIFIAGAVVQWLRDGLGVIETVAQTDQMAGQADAGHDVIIVPAFTGLGAPYWRAECRGAIFGLERNSGPNELAKAALESVAFQTRDLLEAMHADWGSGVQTVIRVDGGMAASDYAMQFISDICTAEVARPKNLETTAMGAAWLAGFEAGICPDRATFAKKWRAKAHFTPNLAKNLADQRYEKWQKAVQATLGAI